MGPIPLSEAWIAFAPPRLRLAYQRYRPGEIYGQPPTPAEIASLDRSELIKRLSAVPGQFLEQLGKVEPPVAADMRNAVLQRLAEGKLLAFGFPVAPAPKHTAEPVPAALLREPYVKWAAGTVEGRGFRFDEVAVKRAEAADRQKGPPTKHATTAAKEASRASLRREAIIQAFREMQKEPGYRPVSPKSERYSVLAKRLSKSRPDIFEHSFGLSYKNIFKILKDLDER
jgi:hypothetical protein